MTETIICRSCACIFSDPDAILREKVAPRIGGAPQLFPLPTLCPSCRLRRRLAFRNNHYVFLRPSSGTGKQIFSWYSADAPFPVYERSLWWGEEWDALSYGREFDFSRPFFAQFRELRDVVPHPALSVLNLENSDYCNNANDLKNCYFVFNSAGSDSCFYSDHIDGSKDCIDCSFSPDCELCFDCVDCLRCYNVQSSESCQQCRDSYFLLNCKNCEHCIGCANLRHAKYCIFNRQVSPAEYHNFIADAGLDSHSRRAQFEEQCASFFVTQPRPHLVGSRIEGGTGNYLHGVKNVQDSFLVTDAEDCRYCFDVHIGIRDCLDLSLFGFNCQLLYECSVAGHNAENMAFCYNCPSGNSNLQYCFYCSSASHCFGCVSVRRKQYCILNKQYDQQTYEATVAKIIEHMRDTGEWGEFFPESMAAFPYNLTLANRYFPRTREQILECGLRFHEFASVEAGGSVNASELPDVTPAADQPLVVRSSRGGKVFRITTPELHLYRKLKIPLPRMAYDERLESRAAKLGGPILTERKCDKTGDLITSTYSNDRPATIWKREEYLREFES